ncbi:MAG TPA: cupin domain-containing protein [Streptosporangiaceae bacterium]|nr:cupin domain-containing protein [Streptosporangiaceae bacterium]
MTPGTVVQAAAVRADRTEAGAVVRTLFGAETHGLGLARCLADIPPRSRLEGTAGAGGELWFVIAGTGTLTVDGNPGLPLYRDRGLRIPPGARYDVQADDDGDLRLDLVTLPGGAGLADLATLVASDLSDCQVETTGDRRFRVLFGPGRGCPVATQFVGEIPPGKAPDHSHPYDEVVLVLEGQGTVHIGGAAHALSAGTCTHLPPGLPHCLENTGSAPMRVLGVFHPADSPAAKLEQ